MGQKFSSALGDSRFIVKMNIFITTELLKNIVSSIGE